MVRDNPICPDNGIQIQIKESTHYTQYLQRQPSNLCNQVEQKLLMHLDQLNPIP